MLGLVSSPHKQAVDGEGIRIYPSRRAAIRHSVVVYSIRVADLRPPERVRALATVTPSYCAGRDIKGNDRMGSPCQLLAQDHIPNPHYPVRLQAHLYRANRPGEASRPSTPRLTDGKAGAVCTKARHHCPLTISSTNLLRGGPKRFINVDLTAWTNSRDWHSDDRLDLDCFQVDHFCDSTRANADDPGRPGERVLQAGQLGLIRFGGAFDSTVGSQSNRVDRSELPVDPGGDTARVVVHSARLDHLAPGDLLETNGTVDLTGDGYDHLGASYWVLARDPTTVRAASGTPDRYLSGFNGVNCLGKSDLLTGTTSGYCSTARKPPTLPLRQLGMGRVPANAPETMYLNYVVLASDGSAPPGKKPTARVDSGSFKLACHPAPRDPGSPPCSITVP